MKSHLTLVFALLLVCTGAAVAQTPDGETPAEEAVCDNETGAAFGLCNAYCEAMDCESDDPQASETACGKIRDKFTQITGRDLPCEVPQVTCPCNDPATNPVFADTVAGLRTIDSCTLSSVGQITVILAPSTPVNNAFVDPISGRCSSSPGMTLPTTPEQAQLCIQLLVQAADAQGVTCN
jgi:hypothetical protein